MNLSGENQYEGSNEIKPLKRAFFIESREKCEKMKYFQEKFKNENSLYLLF
jgi:hypothetical protein